jgi:hypothetical protein
MSPIRLERFESSIRIVLAFSEAFNHRDVEGMLKLLSDDCVIEDHAPAPDGNAYRGKAAISQHLQGFFEGAPDAHLEIEDIFGFGQRCVMRWRYKWGNASGTITYLRGVDIFQMKEKSICEILSYVKG